MKNILFIVAILVSQFSFTQIDSLSLPISFEKVVVVDSISSDELFNRAKMWFVTSFKDANAVIQNESKEDGMIVGKGQFNFVPTILVSSNLIKGPVSYTVTIMVKEGRYKYVISNFIHTSSSPSPQKISCGLITNSEVYPNEPTMMQTARNNNNIWQDVKTQSIEQAKILEKSLILGMQKPSPTKSDDW